MKLIINGEEAKIPSDTPSGGITMDQVNSAIDAKLDAYEPQEVYSTEETRIGTWIDGKPLYRKVVSTITPSTTDQWAAVTSITNADIHMLEAYVVDKFDAFVFIPFVEETTGICLYTKDGVANIKFFGSNASYYTGRPIILILEYTKTTDQAQTTAANAILKAPSKAPALNSIQSAAVTASAQEVLIDG